MHHLENTRPIFEWHSDTFELPSGCELLASSRSCPNQAFRHGENVYGFQFHMEVDGPLVERWLQTPVYQAEIAEMQGKIDPDVIRVETAKNIEQLKVLSSRVFGSFLDLMGRVNRTTHLSSI